MLRQFVKLLIALRIPEAALHLLIAVHIFQKGILFHPSRQPHRLVIIALQPWICTEIVFLSEIFRLCGEDSPPRDGTFQIHIQHLFKISLCLMIVLILQALQRPL